jgi:hypothetical protein
VFQYAEPRLLEQFLGRVFTATEAMEVPQQGLRVTTDKLLSGGVVTGFQAKRERLIIRLRQRHVCRRGH